MCKQIAFGTNNFNFAFMYVQVVNHSQACNKLTLEFSLKTFAKRAENPLESLQFSAFHFIFGLWVYLTTLTYLYLQM